MKKIVTVASSLLLALATLQPVSAQEEDFDTFLENEFIEAMESDYLTMHFTVKDYQALGIEKGDISLGEATYDSYQEEVERMNESLAKLESYDYDSLTKTQQTDYDVYHFYLEAMRDMNMRPMYDEIFAPSTGIQTNILTNFTEFVFYEKQDVEDYLTVLQDVPVFMADALTVTKMQASEGYFLTDAGLDNTLDGIAKFTAKKEDNELIVIFNENTDALDFLSEEEKIQCQEENREIILNQFIPCYENLYDELESLRGSRKQSGGMSSYGEDGEAFYRALVRYRTSSSASVEEQVEMCKDYLENLIDAYMKLIRSNRNIEEQFENESIDMETAEEILDYLQNHLQDYPEGPEVVYHSSYLDPSVANDTVVAYYMQPPFDDLKDNVIKINGDSISDTTELYSTLAHEGFPGHLYQITWYLNTNPAHLRAALSNLGYTEGWAMYAECNQLMDSGLSEDVAMMNRINTTLSYVMDAFIDLGVNGLGWSVEEAADQLEEIGLNGESAMYLYDYVVQNPGVLLSYGCGLMRFDNLRSQAEKALGSDFDVQEFNTVLLTGGDRTFEMVQADVDAYIESKTGSAPSTPSVSTTTEEVSDEAVNWLLVTGVSAVLLLVVVIIFKKHRKKDPLA